MLVSNISESLIFRGRDAANHLGIQAETGNLILFIRVAGAKTIRHRVDGAIQAGVAFKLHVEIRGTELKVFVNDELVMTRTEEGFMNDTLAGLNAWTSSSTIGYFDNFKVETL